ncbi:MAG TPA: fibronectin type III domain-containing protein, partial [Acidimicrobiales bacterium]|nr:fibronectin type III domain-containing protein [Acidimicrobiales bacterium]
MAITAAIVVPISAIGSSSTPAAASTKPVLSETFSHFAPGCVSPAGPRRAVPIGAEACYQVHVALPANSGVPSGVQLDLGFVTAKDQPTAAEYFATAARPGRPVLEPFRISNASGFSPAYQGAPSPTSTTTPNHVVLALGAPSAGQRSFDVEVAGVPTHDASTSSPVSLAARVTLARSPAAGKAQSFNCGPVGCAESVLPSVSSFHIVTTINLGHATKVKGRSGVAMASGTLAMTSKITNTSAVAATDSTLCAEVTSGARLVGKSSVTRGSATGEAHLASCGSAASGGATMASLAPGQSESLTYQVAVPGGTRPPACATAAGGYCTSLQLGALSGNGTLTTITTAPLAVRSALTPSRQVVAEDVHTTPTNGGADVSQSVALDTVNGPAAPDVVQGERLNYTVTVTVPDTVPGAPSAVGATAGSGQVSLAWTAPASDGGSAVTGYNVYEGTAAGGEATTPVNGSTPLAATTTSYVVGGLTNGTTYFFTIKAVNSVGTSGPSDEVSATPAAPPAVPGAPTGLAATAGNGQVSLTWTPPTSTGGSTITGYDVYQGTTTGGESTTAVNALPVSGTTYVVGGLTNGTTYYFTVEAINAIGNSAPSNEASATPVAPPSPPSGLVASAGNAQVSLTWTAPASDGGSAITGYNVYEGTTAGGESTTPVNSSPLIATTYTVTGLNNGTTYFFTVEAVNTVGNSGASNEVAATPVAPPAAPTLLPATGGNAQVSLTWTAPTSNGGSAVTGYDIYVGTTAGGESATPVNSLPVAGTTHTVTGLTNG